MALSIIQTSLFDSFGDLPLHPLAVHGAAVLIPLSALALLALAFVPKWRATYFPLTLVGLALSAGVAFVAKESGEALAQKVGNPEQHAALGDVLFPASVGMLLLGLAFFGLTKTNGAKWQQNFAAGLAVLAALSVGVLTYFVGHTGAEATWGNRVSQAQGEELVSPTDPASLDVAGALTAQEVATHNSKTDCWTVIDGQVYDLTSYIEMHAGGPLPLESICGKDGTKAFSNQHSGEKRPAADLSMLFLGPLSGVTTTEPSPSASATETSSAVGALTAAEVAKHSTAESCWSVVDSNVYDLTSYVSNHPGGAAVIKAICGKDGTSAFTNQHGTSGRPSNVLAGFKLGALATAAAGGSLPTATVNPGEYEEENEENERDND
jgi:cytochrome b involved in lipid metabolism